MLTKPAAATASAVSPIRLNEAGTTAARISPVVLPPNVSYAEPTAMAVAATATNTADRDDETVSSHMPKTNVGSTPSSGQLRP